MLIARTRAALALTAIFVSTWCAAQDLPADSIAAIDRCVQARVASEARFRDALASFQPSDAAIFLSERLTRDMRYDAARREWSGRASSETPQAYCAEVVNDFLGIAEKAYAARPPGLAPVGSHEIASDSFAVQTYQDLIGKHYRGHSDLSAAAAKAEGWSAAAADLFAMSSQLSDLYRWKDERFHAQSRDVSGLQVLERRRVVGESQKEVATLFGRLVQASEEAAQGDDLPLAIGLVGMSAHLVQDLVFHKGMTMAQHAGLAYLKQRNPDQLPDPDGGQTYKEALRRTRWLLSLVASSLPAETMDRMKSWSPRRDYRRSEFVESVLRRVGGGIQQDISTTELMKYWALSWTYRSGQRDERELEASSCGSDQGVVCWPLDAMFDRLRAATRR